MDDLYILARRVLLDALEAIGSHKDAVILVSHRQSIHRSRGNFSLVYRSGDGPFESP